MAKQVKFIRILFCKRCQHFRPTTEFYNDKRTYCKSCAVASAIKYNTNNPEAYKEAHAKHAYSRHHNQRADLIRLLKCLMLDPVKKEDGNELVDESTNFMSREIQHVNESREEKVLDLYQNFITSEYS